MGPGSFSLPILYLRPAARAVAATFTAAGITAVAATGATARTTARTITGTTVGTSSGTTAGASSGTTTGRRPGITQGHQHRGRIGRHGQHAQPGQAQDHLQNAGHDRHPACGHNVGAGPRIG